MIHCARSEFIYLEITMYITLIPCECWVMLPYVSDKTSHTSHMHVHSPEHTCAKSRCKLFVQEGTLAMKWLRLFLLWVGNSDETPHLLRWGEGILKSPPRQTPSTQLTGLCGSHSILSLRPRILSRQTYRGKAHPTRHPRQVAGDLYRTPNSVSHKETALFEHWIWKSLPQESTPSLLQHKPLSRISSPAED